ncbi:hypothetical protein COU56_05295 [Candidatus Pacearchaeota archaeon CG10_big_fil_rev_8_21_14_0_10_31_9]|nr:MAG: hypothetical protein COU56_05295 [Candidatus Pacearchaeota archaeon CG10_big_fil_rev_8_21_14_0_10_31_9]
MEKRGFLAVEWIVAIVLILVGLGILVFAATNFFTKTDIDKNTCHFSVISRGSTPSLAKGYVPLRCKTEKICITGELFGGGCDEFKGEKGVTRIRVSDSSVQGLEQVQKVYAQSILECWEMMGEGKVGLFSLGAAKNFGFGLVYPSCVVCSRIAIDKDSLTNVPFENMNINEYMRSHLAPKTEKTYFDYMLGEEYAASYSVADNLLNLPDFDVKKDKGGKDIDLVKKDQDTSVELVDPSIISTSREDDLKETAIMFMQISSPSHGGVISNSVGAAAGIGTAGYFSFGPAFLAAGSKTIKGLFSVPGAVIAGILGISQQGSVTISRGVSVGYCGDVEVSDDARSGCSAVRTVNYDLTSISEYCQVIEGLP